MTKILLVEDDKSLREIYGVRLLAEGYDIVSAGDGEEALAMAIKERPDLIVSDVMMPKISGFDMLDILRSTTETKNIRVIMMTALSSEDQRLRGEQLGADRYLVKSQVGIEDVVRTVHDVLGDAPAASTPQNIFATPGPTAATWPAQSAPQQANTNATPAPAGQQPAMHSPAPNPAAPASTPQQPAMQAYQAPQPTPQPAPQPVTPQPVQQQQPAPTPNVGGGLPQPTAPFSTQRPTNLANRIIQPMQKPAETGEPISNLMDRELGNTPPTTAPEPLQAPAALSPAMVTPEAPVAPQPMATPAPTPAPETEPMQPFIQQPEPQTPSQPAPENHGISFEETPRPDGTQSS